MMKASDSIVPTIPLSSISTTSSSAKKKRRYPADTGAKIWVAAMTPWLEGLAINSVYSDDAINSMEWKIILFSLNILSSFSYLFFKKKLVQRTHLKNKPMIRFQLRV
jgi:hypothetical protein